MRKFKISLTSNIFFKYYKDKFKVSNNMRILIVTINLFLFSNAYFSQPSSVTPVSKDVRNIELRYINHKELNAMTFDLSKLAVNKKETHHYYVDANENVFFLVKDKEQLIEYVTRVYNDNDLINKVSRNVFYILDTNSDLTTNKVETLKVDLLNKKIIQ